jgi:hypothetical protein
MARRWMDGTTHTHARRTNRTQTDGTEVDGTEASHTTDWTRTRARTPPRKRVSATGRERAREGPQRGAGHRRDVCDGHGAVRAGRTLWMSLLTKSSKASFIAFWKIAFWPKHSRTSSRYLSWISSSSWCARGARARAEGGQRERTERADAEDGHSEQGHTRAHTRSHARSERVRASARERAMVRCVRAKVGERLRA